ncbi:MAG: PotD/PotF family extracellular solute-binding protein [Ignavibacteriales bacterium]|nr:PotD/PotF family extracellular solute-binding protein [Ignavibacteriales bacterium]
MPAELGYNGTFGNADAERGRDDSRRRAVLAAILVGLAALPAVSVSCGKARPVLRVYTWSDYIKPELVRRFEREQACRVVLDTFESNEAMYAKIKAGATGYDLLDAVELHGQPDERPGACCAASTAPSSPTSSTSTPTTSPWPSTRPWTTPSPT